MSVKTINANKKVVFTILSLVFVIITLINLDFSVFRQFISKIKVQLIIYSFIFYFSSTLLRSIRWKYIFSKKDLKEWFVITSINVMSNNIYPARTGELTLFFLADDIQKSEILSGFIISRFMDLICISLIVLIALSNVVLTNMSKVRIIMVLIITIVVMFIIMMNLNKLAKVITKIEKLPIKVKDFIIVVSDFYEKHKAKTFTIFVTSFLVWSSKYISTYFLAKNIFESISKDFSFWEIIFGVTFSELTTVLPIHNFGGFGTYETGWALLFIILGLDKREAYSTGFVFHVLLLLYSLILGLPSLILYTRGGGRTPHRN